MTYAEGAFYKQLLQSVTQKDANDTAFNTHVFDYYDDTREADGSYTLGNQGTFLINGVDRVVVSQLHRAPGVVFTLEEIDAFRKKDPDTRLILLRNDTVPDDILEIDAADGILTARGGLTSHAAVVAYNLGKSCVVGCENLVCNEPKKECMINGIKMTTGDYISINGQKGSVYKGSIKLN